MWIWMIVIAAVVAVDQITKFLVMSLFELGESIPVIPNVFNFTYVLNDGMAFGLLDDERWIFMTVSVLAIAALLFYMWKYKPSEKLACAGLSLVIGGGIGNMIDRLFYGESFGNGSVVDFIDFCALPNVWKWVFNVADACVCIGAGLLIFYLIRDIVREAKNEKLKKDETVGEDADAE